MNKVLVVDDESLSRKKILRFLENRHEKFHILEAKNGLEAFNLIEKEDPEIVFLDIEMPEMNGMDLVQSLPSHNFKLVFQTAYSEYAVKAFEKNAVDYILKPFNQERFNQSLDKCLEAKSPVKMDEIAALRESFVQKDIYLKKVIVKRGTKNTIIDINDIKYFRSESHYTYVCTDSFEYIHNEALKDLILKLNPDMFMQIHRNAIIRMDDVTEVIEGENMQVVMSNDTKLQVSRSNRKKIKELILKK